MSSHLHLDFSNIPLYQREEEIAQLKAVYQRVVVSASSSSSADDGDSLPQQTKSELVLVDGYSGTGKTRLVNNAFNDEAAAGYFCSGKFDQNQASMQPHAAVVEALNELCKAVVDNEDKVDLDVIRASLRDSLGKGDPTVLLNTLPNFRELLGKEHLDSTDTTVDSEMIQKDFAFEKLKLSLRSLLRTISKPSRPVVVFVDDLQWTDETSLDLIEFLATDEKAKGLLFVLAYRGNEVNDEHPLSLKLQKLSKLDDHITITNIHIRNLDFQVVNELVAQLTKRDVSETMSLTEVVFDRTLGNAFFVIQFLRSLEERNLVCYSVLSLKVEWDVDKIRAETSMSDNVVDFMARKIGSLPCSGRDALKVGSCIGISFHLQLVASVLDLENDDGCSPQQQQQQASSSWAVGNKESVCAALEVAVEEGLIEKKEGPSPVYRFLHDRIQQGAYSLISEGLERDTIHLRIGRLAKQLKDSQTGQDWMLMIAANQLNLVPALIDDEEERIEIAKLNLDAAEAAWNKSAFFPAANYLKSGLAMLPGEKKWEDYYDLTLQLCTKSAEMEYCRGNFARMQEIVDEVLLYSRSLSDRLHVLFIQVEAQGSGGDLNKALEVGIDVLRQLGFRYPKNPGTMRILLDLLKTKRMLRGRSDEDLLALPVVTDILKTAASKMAQMCSYYAWQIGSGNDVFVLTLRQLQATLSYGRDKTTPVKFALYGMIMGYTGDYDEADRFGRLALELGRGTKSQDPRSLSLAMAAGYHLKHPVQDTVEPFIRSYRLSMETGDLRHAALNCVNYGLYFFLAGLPLDTLTADLKSYISQLISYRQENICILLRILRQCALNLQGSSDDPLVLTGQAVNQQEVEIQAVDTHNEFAMQCIWFYRMYLGCIFEDSEMAWEMADRLWGTTFVSGTFYPNFVAQFFIGLISIQLARKTGKRKYKTRSRKVIKQFEKWVKGKLVNCHHMLLLLRAENDAQKGEPISVKLAYDQAISSACRSGFMHHAALANERAGWFFLEQKDKDWAELYLLRSYELFDEWGAKAKTAQLEERHECLSRVGRENTASRIKSNRFLGRAHFSSDGSRKHEGLETSENDSSMSSSLFFDFYTPTRPA